MLLATFAMVMHVGYSDLTTDQKHVFIVSDGEKPACIKST